MAQQKQTVSITADKTQRIGIIGAGPAGLAAAWKLMDKGYFNVTVLEKESEVGGKCLTISNESDGRLYELGAEYITYAYDTVFFFLDMLGIGSFPSGDVIIMKGNGVFENPLVGYPIAQVLKALITYIKLGFEYRELISNPSNVNISNHPVLSMSTQQLMDEYDLNTLRGLILVPQFGYGPLDEFPAIFQFRAVPYNLLVRIIIDQLEDIAKELGLVHNADKSRVHIPFIDHWMDLSRPIASMSDVGTQGLFKQLADKLNEMKAAHYADACVVTGAEVTAIEEQAGSGFVLATQNGQYSFDKVIAAVPPNFIASRMSLPDEWTRLFNKTMFHPYWIGLMKLDRSVQQYYYQNLDIKKYEPSQLGERYPDEGDMLIWGYNWESADEARDGDAAIDDTLGPFMKDMFLVDSYTKTSFEKYWDFYHPHVTLGEFHAQYYDEMERFQGYGNGMYLTGSAMSHESMEYACKYSLQLIDRFFE